MNCPRDGTYLQKDFHKHIMLDTCSTCSGIFISLNELLNHFEIPDLAEKLRDKADNSAPSEFKCPRCAVLQALSTEIEATMHPVIVRQTEIDICGHCLGIWFDGGELERIMPQKEYTRLMAMKEEGRIDTGLMEKARQMGLETLSSISSATPKDPALVRAPASQLATSHAPENTRPTSPPAATTTTPPVKDISRSPTREPPSSNEVAVTEQSTSKPVKDENPSANKPVKRTTSSGPKSRTVKKKIAKKET